MRTSEAAADLRLDRLAGWLVTRGLADSSAVVVMPMAGGTQNVMLDIAVGSRRYVLRAGPAGGGTSATDMVARETRVLAALDGTKVPHPTLVAAEPDASLLGRPFYLTERVAGISAVRSDGCVPSGQAVATALLDLAAIVPAEIGLTDFGRAEGWLERQVPRWLWQLDNYQHVAGYPGHGLPHVNRVARWLEEHRPGDQSPGVLHGDFHLGNLLFNSTGDIVRAIVDWELATLGDPLLDLAELLVTWPDQSGRSVIGDVASISADHPADRPATIFDCYRQRTTRDTSAIGWYLVLACFRLGILLEGSRARAFAGESPEAVGESLHAAAVRLLDKADALRDRPLPESLQ